MMNRSPVVKGKLAKEYAKNYYAIEDDIVNVFEKIDTPFLDERLKPGMRVMDATMGRGRHAVRYAKRGCKVWGNDLNPYMVSYARSAAKGLGAKMRFSVLDARKLKGVPSNEFDVTYSMFSSIGTIPGSKNRQQVMDSMARVTKRGGLVMVHAHNFLDCFLRPDFFWWAVKSSVAPDKGLEPRDMVTDYNGLQDMYNHFYTPGELRRSMRKAGLEVVEEHYIDCDKCRFVSGPLRRLHADGFIFVARKR